MVFTLLTISVTPEDTLSLNKLMSSQEINGNIVCFTAHKVHATLILNPIAP